MAIISLFLVQISRAAFTCPPDIGPIFVPDPEDCTKFYLCVFGVATEYKCPDGTHFSPVILDCLPEEEAGCTATTISPPETTTSDQTEPSPESTTLGQTSSPETTTSGQTEPPPFCPPEGSVSIPHPTDCTKFYVCVSGEPILLDCPPGLHFSPTELICLAPEEAGCDLKPTTSVPTSTESTEAPVICPPTGSDFIPHPTDCSKYYLCMSGIPFLMECPPGEHFSPSDLICLPPDEAGCQIATTTLTPDVCPPTGTDFLPYPGDCTQYYLCMAGESTVMKCPNNFHFSPTEKQCLPPGEAGCITIFFDIQSKLRFIVNNLLYSVEQNKK